jgi:Histidine kinase-, DNA gyrase B-, and HSP90-like ATPase
MMSESADDPAKVDAEPTKEFFVSMLIRDIELIPALVDLVDNSVDGARRLRGSDNFEGLFVRIDATAESFRIADNCGGIPINIARHYAFRFGRTERTPQLPRSVGQFGVGMKRALFKLGSAFEIRSVEATSDFVLVRFQVPDSRPEGCAEWMRLAVDANREAAMYQSYAAVLSTIRQMLDQAGCRSPRAAQALVTRIC